MTKSKPRIWIVAKMAFAFTLLVVGAVLALPGIPGPGIALILLALWLLRDHFAWAARAHAWVMERARQWRRKAAGKSTEEAETAPGVPRRS
jgi:hypothetical protein